MEFEPSDVISIAAVDVIVRVVRSDTAKVVVFVPTGATCSVYTSHGSLVIERTVERDIDPKLKQDITVIVGLPNEMPVVPMSIVRRP